MAAPTRLGDLLVDQALSVDVATQLLKVMTTPAPPGAAGGQTLLSQGATAAAAPITLTLPGVAGKTTYLTGFSVTGLGATGATTINVTITGPTQTLTYTIPIPAGATTAITPLVVSFPSPVPASGPNTAIVVNVPSFGAGNTSANATAQGFQQ